MRTIRLRLAFILCLAAGSCADIRADEQDEKKPGVQQDFVLPATFERGSLRLRGYAGSFAHLGFLLELFPNGTLRVELNPSPTAAPAKEVRLTNERTQEFYAAMVKIIAPTDHNKIVGAVPNGWDVTAVIELDGRKKDVTYERFGSIRAISPEFCAITDLVHREMPEVKLTAVALETLWKEERARQQKKEESRDEQQQFEAPATFEQGALSLSGYAGTFGDRTHIRVELLPDGTLHFERCREQTVRREVKLTKRRTKEFYDAMVKIVSESDREKRRGRSEDGWCITAIIWLNDGRIERNYGGFGSVQGITPEFRSISELINEELPGTRFPE